MLAGCVRPAILGAEVVRKVVAFERRKAKLKADVDKESGRDEREKDRAEGVEIAARRPDDRLPAAPLLDGGHGYFSLFWLRLARSSCAFAALVVWTWRKRTVSCSWASLVAAQQRFERVHQKHLNADEFGEDVHVHLRVTADNDTVQQQIARPFAGVLRLRDEPLRLPSPRCVSLVLRLRERRSRPRSFSELGCRSCRAQP